MTQPLDPVHTRAPVFSPGSGAPGTEVSVETRDLPALTPVYLGMGATRSSFEVLSQLVTSELGEMSTVVEVPDWATPDRTHYFVLVDVYFRPLAVSAAFHVTEPDGTLRRRGAIADGEGGCLTLREAGEGEEIYVLTGDVQDLALGDEVLVEATLGESPGCGQGTALQVTRAERLD
ncbi:MAG: hypothetical protein OXG72_19710 [Acidobacteria bacterium]|nr:hypothetical protein [Acidobacteriota bacterium]